LPKNAICKYLISPKQSILLNKSNKKIRFKLSSYFKSFRPCKHQKKKKFYWTL